MIISKPESSVLNKALDHAALLRESDNDPYGIAHALLYLSQQNTHLESVVTAAKEYLQFGEEAQLHTLLVKAIQAFDDYEQETIETENPRFGLD